MSRWPLKKIYFWEEMPFFRLLLPLVAGIFLYDFLDVPIREAYYLLTLLLLIMVLITTYQIAALRAYASVAIFFSVHIFLMIAGYGLYQQYDIQNHPKWFAHYLNDAEACQATITHPPEEKAKTWKLELDINHVVVSGKEKAVKGKAIAYVYKGKWPLQLAEGDEIILPNNWQRIRNAGNPHEFDYAQYAARNNVYYRQFLPFSQIERFHNATSGDTSFIRLLHHRCMQRLERYITDNHTLGLMQAMLLGDDANMDGGLRQAYADTGIVHIVAISGAHISVFFVLIAFLLSFIRHNKYKWVKYLAALPLIWLYVLVAGAPPSAVRAACMFSLLAIGLAFKKQAQPVNILLGTAFILLLANPAWLFAVGFQLSFVAVLSIMLFYKPIYGWLNVKNNVLRKLWAAMAVSIAAEILIAPLVIYYFHLFPAMFLIANLAAYLFMSIVLILGMAIIATGFYAPVAEMLSSIVTNLVSFFNKVIYVFRELNPESFHYLHLKSFELILVYVVIGGIAVFLLKKRKAALLAGMTTACMLLFSFCINEWIAQGQEKLVVYNINHANYIEYIKGKHFTPLSANDDISESKFKYATANAHTMWHAWREDSTFHLQHVFRVGDATVLILDKAILSEKGFSVDYVIVTFLPKKNDLKQVATRYHPRKIILPGKISRNASEKLKAQYADELSIHAVSTDGAFVLGAR